jgi:hypothetical protein
MSKLSSMMAMMAAMSAMGGNMKFGARPGGAFNPDELDMNTYESSKQGMKTWVTTKEDGSVYSVIASTRKSALKKFKRDLKDVKFSDNIQIRHDEDIV